MNRPLAILLGVVLGGFAVALLALAIAAEPETLLGTDLAWFEPYFRVGGILVGGITLAASLTLIGIGLGHWRHPLPVGEGHQDDRVQR